MKVEPSSFDVPSLLTSRRGTLDGRCKSLRLMLCMPSYWKKALKEGF